VELGAGDGALMLGLARELAGEWKGAQVILVDKKNALTPRTRDGFGALGWRLETAIADVFDWLQKSEAMADIIIANLFLHHFQEKELARLLALAAARCGVFAACEPRRALAPLAFSRMVGLIGCNSVTRHDAVVSVRAGFAGSELSALWPAKPQWRLRERRAGLFTHSFLAQRDGAS
jgi:spermidine synthase